MAELQWVRGVSDKLLYNLVYWYKNYDQGSIYSTKEYEDMITKEKKQLVTCRVHSIKFRRPDLKHLYDLLGAVDTNSVQYKLFEDLYKNFKYKKGIPIGTSKIFTIAMKKTEIHGIIHVLENLFYGKTLNDGVIGQEKEKNFDEQMAEGGLFYEEI